MLADIIISDLKGLLRRLPGLETLAFNDGTPFADEVTLNWINQSVQDEMSNWRDEPVNALSETGNDILALEPEALEKADTDGLMPHSTGCKRARAPTPQRQMVGASADGTCGGAEG